MGIEESIFQAYLETERIYQEIKKRKSCMNVNIRLYQLLRAHNYDCQLDDFKILSTRKCLLYCNEIFKEMCEKFKGQKLKFTPII